ncbi:HlyD family efflux transporter periplasmic adaptor subunit [Actinomycetospora sp. OC33-EN08]|uniref:HlyD family efflux transporter periplasmic adaptor subunit n=1 Tax=Actinomycetospora aurantiaca TaxID=3129233 RepID=A0ABU8ML72_9PSEU
MTGVAVVGTPSPPARRPRRRGRAVVATLVLLAVVVVVGGLALGADAPPRVETVPVGRGSVVAEAHTGGTVVSRTAAAAGFAVDGVVATVEVSDGAVVSTGDVLATLDDRAARPRMEAAAAAVTADEQARDAAAAAPVPDPVALARLDATLSADRAALAEARRVVDAGVLRAPQDGTVTAVRVQAGTRVTAGSPPAVEIADLAALAVRVGLEPAQVASVLTGRTAFVTPGAGTPGADPAATARRRGEVVAVAPAPGPDGRYAVSIAAPLPDSARIGLPVDVDVVLARRDGVLVLPPEAVRPGPAPGTATVVVQRGQGPAGAVATTVGVGLVGDGGVEVLDGLDEGDVVVLGAGPAPATAS